jgi:phage tail tape-measure protein
MDDQDKDAIGQMVGTGLGMTTGARIGSAVIPIPVVGAFTGGVLGAFAGSELGRRAGHTIIDGALSLADVVWTQISTHGPAPEPIALPKAGETA